MPTKIETDLQNSKADELLERLRTKILSRGTRGIFGLGKSFHIIDKNKSSSVDVTELA